MVEDSQGVPGLVQFQPGYFCGLDVFGVELLEFFLQIGLGLLELSLFG